MQVHPNQLRVKAVPDRVMLSILGGPEPFVFELTQENAARLVNQLQQALVISRTPQEDVAGLIRECGGVL